MSFHHDLQIHEPTGSRANRQSQALRQILRCPRCGSTLEFADSSAACASHHDHAFRVIDGVPVFNDGEVEIRSLDHTSHQAGASTVGYMIEGSRAAGDRPWLHLGAGATADCLPNSIELETAIFRNTHVVGDVHHLPFADNSLGGVLALNVFEHLSDPEQAAAELHRCMHPGSRLFIHTAFLQPTHADPYHFYNATEVGVRRWFSAFDIEAVEVPYNFNPAFAASWFASDLLHHTGEAKALAKLTLAELAGFWRDPESRKGPAWDAFMNLSDTARRTLAAGFEVRAHVAHGAEASNS